MYSIYENKMYVHNELFKGTHRESPKKKKKGKKPTYHQGNISGKEVKIMK